MSTQTIFSAAGAIAGAAAKDISKFIPSAAPNVYLSFQGIGFSSGHRRRFDVACGPNPPTITDGYANWQNVARPLQRGLTILQGYDPAQMTVDIIFGSWIGGWDISDQAGVTTEDAIGDLEWMAGGNFTSGPSPAVYVFSRSGLGGDTDLIPPQYRGMPWVINGGVQWGTAYRNRNGYRVWQEATVTLENYLNLNAPPAPDTNTSGSYFNSSPGHDKAISIASAPAVQSPTVDHASLARRILTDPKNNPVKGTKIKLQGKSVYWPIRHGLSIWIPAHQTD